MDTQTLQRIIEGVLLAAAAPVSVKRLAELLGEDEAPPKEALEEALVAIAAACEGRGFELKEVASGWRFQVREEMAPWVNRLWEEKPQKYSRALLETLALIAYRQPITRGDIEDIRGVAVSSHIIKTLVERNWVKIVGHRDVPGRPSLYATTREFLDYFNLKSLDELPSLSEIRDLDEINASLDLNIEMGLAEANAQPKADEDGEAQHDNDLEDSELEHGASDDIPEQNESELTQNSETGHDDLESDSPLAAGAISVDLPGNEDEQTVPDENAPRAEITPSEPSEPLDDENLEPESTSDERRQY